MDFIKFILLCSFSPLLLYNKYSRNVGMNKNFILSVISTDKE